MFSFANMVHFLTHKLARLCRGRFALTLIPSGPLKCLFFRHNASGPSKKWLLPGHNFVGQLYNLRRYFLRLHGGEQLSLGFQPMLHLMSGFTSAFLIKFIRATGDLLLAGSLFGFVYRFSHKMFLH
jgi:hypothetical protein